jgi:hypothetical protein
MGKGAYIEGGDVYLTVHLESQGYGRRGREDVSGGGGETGLMG